MKILIISDIHSNYEALKSVVEKEGTDQVWCLGDLVDYGPEPAETVKWVRENVSYCVRGNHDQAMAFGVSCRCGEKFREMSEVSRGMNKELLAREDLDYLRRLPTTATATVLGYKFFMSHATPDGDMYRYLKPDVSDEELARLLEKVDADFVFGGHTHLPMARQIGRKCFVNPGSVGQQRDGTSEARYAIWEDGNVELKQAGYDIEKSVGKLKERPLPQGIFERLACILRTGSDLPATA